MSRTILLACLLLPVTAMAQTIHDPTERTRASTVGSAPASVQGMRLQSTLIAADRRIASINDEIVGVGDRIGNAVVVEILPYAVKLRAAGRIIELRLDSGADPKSGERG